jgi:hypothetical protein
MSGLLVDAQSSTGKLFRVDPATGTSTEVDLGGVALSSVDGLELQGSTLFAVRNSNVVTAVRLGSQLASGTVFGDITDPGLDVSTNGTVAAGRSGLSTPDSLRGRRLTRSTGSRNGRFVQPAVEPSRSRFLGQTALAVTQEFPGGSSRLSRATFWARSPQCMPD